MNETSPLDASSESDPARLIDGSCPIAQLLRDEACRHPGPSPTFAGLQAVRIRRQVARNLGFALLLALPLVAVALRREETPLSIAAEATPITRQRIAARLQPPPVKEPAAKVPGVLLQHEEQEPASAPSTSKKTFSVPDSEKAPPTRAIDCSPLSRQGRFEEALSCLAESARSQGMSAELALLESARLRRNVLGDLSSALSDLETYQERFPSGVLRREAGLLQIDVLTKMGEHQAARARISSLLPEVPEQRTELQLKMFELDLLLSDCDGAKRTLAELGSHSDVPEVLRERLSRCHPIDRR